MSSGHITASADNKFCYAEIGGNLVKIEVSEIYGRAPVLLLTCKHADIVLQSLSKNEVRLVLTVSSKSKNDRSI